MSFEPVEQLKQKTVPANQLCRVLAVSRSDGYPARKREQAQSALRQTSVRLKAAFADSGGAYGSRSLRPAMASGGTVIGIYRLR